MTVLCLRVLQAALVYVNALMLHDVLGEDDWASARQPGGCAPGRSHGRRPEQCATLDTRSSYPHRRARDAGPELTDLVERLAHVMEVSYIPTWLIKPIACLDDRRPVDAIRDGYYRVVSRLVAAIEGMPVA